MTEESKVEGESLIGKMCYSKLGGWESFHEAIVKSCEKSNQDKEKQQLLFESRSREGFKGWSLLLDSSNSFPFLFISEYISFLLSSLEDTSSLTAKDWENFKPFQVFKKVHFLHFTQKYNLASVIQK